MSREYVVSDNTSLGRDDTEMREEAAEYFSHNPEHRRCGFVFCDEQDIERIERGKVLFLDTDDMYIYINEVERRKYDSRREGIEE